MVAHRMVNWANERSERCLNNQQRWAIHRFVVEANVHEIRLLFFCVLISVCNVFIRLAWLNNQECCSITWKAKNSVYYFTLSDVAYGSGSHFSSFCFQFKEKDEKKEKQICSQSHILCTHDLECWCVRDWCGTWI